MQMLTEQIQVAAEFPHREQTLRLHLDSYDFLCSLDAVDPAFGANNTNDTKYVDVLLENTELVKKSIAQK